MNIIMYMPFPMYTIYTICVRTIKIIYQYLRPITMRLSDSERPPRELLRRHGITGLDIFFLRNSF